MNCVSGHCCLKGFYFFIITVRCFLSPRDFFLSSTLSGHWEDLSLCYISQSAINLISMWKAAVWRRSFSWKKIFFLFYFFVGKTHKFSSSVLLPDGTDNFLLRRKAVVVPWKTFYTCHSADSELPSAANLRGEPAANTFSEAAGRPERCFFLRGCRHLSVSSLQVKALTLFVTHYPPLCELERLYPGHVSNHHMAFLLNEPDTPADADGTFCLVLLGIQSVVEVFFIALHLFCFWF